MTIEVVVTVGGTMRQSITNRLQTSVVTDAYTEIWDCANCLGLSWRGEIATEAHRLNRSYGGGRSAEAFWIVQF